MNKNIKLIISHPGKTHRDDFLAIGLIQSICGKVIKVERRNPTQEELDDPDIAVVDFGGRHDPKTSCYDHHQFPRGTKECALTLVAQSYKVEKVLSRFDWYFVTTILDSCGPFAVARNYGLESFPPGLMSPIENSILRHTRKFPEVEAKISKQVMDDVLEEAWETDNNIKWLRENARLEHVREIPVIWSEIHNLNDLAKNQYRKEVSFQTKNSVAIQVYYDNRNEGMTFFRFDDDKRIDFSKLENDPKILFAHKNGFIAKTKEKLSFEQCAKLIEQSIVG